MTIRRGKLFVELPFYRHPFAAERVFFTSLSLPTVPAGAAQKFGNPRVIASACSTALMELPSFHDVDFKSLQKFSAASRSWVASLRFGGYGIELQTHANLAHVENKLSYLLRSRWAKFS